MSGPHWTAIIVGVLAVLSGAINLIQFWKSKDTVRYKAAAESWEANCKALEAERTTLRERRDALQAESAEKDSQIAVLKAKTDLNGLKAQVTKSLADLRDEFKEHTQADLAIAQQQVAATQQQTAALEAVKATLKVVQEQVRK